MGVCVGAMATTMMDTILQAGSVCAFLAVGLYFFCEAGGVVPKGAYVEGVIEAGYAARLFLDVLLKGINMVLLALLGAGCMLWPHIETRFVRRADAKEQDEPMSPKQVTDTDVESGASEPEGVPPPEQKKKPKRAKLYYLTHMKTFLTFCVVTFHVGWLWGGGRGGIVPTDIRCRGVLCLVQRYQPQLLHGCLLPHLGVLLPFVAGQERLPHVRAR